MALIFTEAQKAEAEKLLESGLVGDVLFWETTYQVEVGDLYKKNAYWPLLQISDEGNLLDALCSCAISSETVCAHSIAAFRKIIGKDLAPLHVRFKESLWYQIGEISSRRHGYEIDCGRLESDTFTVFSSTQKKIFSLIAKTEKGKAVFKKIFFERSEKDESNSLEFSNRSAEEMKLWREGKPTHNMLFSLSFWCDLAKWWMELQEASKEIKIEFYEQEGLLPKGLKADLKEVEIQFFIAETNWARLIPTLKSTFSSLRVYDEERETSFQLEYDQEKKGFICHRKRRKTDISTKEIAIGYWLYVYKDGFYPASIDPIFNKDFIDKEEVSFLLSYRKDFIEKKLEKVKIFKNKKEANYDLFFDASNHLHINLYVFEKNDLLSFQAALFGVWAFIPNQGFVELEKLEFENIETLIPREKVSDFITENKNWLSQQKGFESHISSLEAQLGYEWLDGDLHFYRALDKSIMTEDVIDFGEWVYVKTRGFFSKKAADISSVVHANLKIDEKDLASFISKNKEELQSIRDFFAKECPVIKGGLSVTIDDKDKIHVKPSYDFKSGYSAKDLKFFGRFVYAKNEGFSELPKSAILPLDFQTERTIGVFDVKNFLLHTLDSLEPIYYLDPRLINPKNLKLTVSALEKQKERGFWNFDIYYESEQGRASIQEVWQAYKQHKTFAYTKAGLIDLSEQKFAWLQNISEEAFENQSVILSSLDWYKIGVYDSASVADAVLDNPEMRAQLIELNELSTKDKVDLQGFKSNLRGYQETGVRWLFSLYSLGLSGLLCDEMGLGKTHQAMGLIAAVSNIHKLEKYKLLIVCPTSVIYHWESQIKKYLPMQKVHVFYGTQRSLEHFQKEGGLLLTSYGILRSESKAFSDIKFDISIFDELQVAKNPSSKTNRSLRLVKAGMKVGLTGTPIENRIEELKALLDVVLPGYLPKKEAFTQQFIIPIEKEGDPVAKQKLKHLVKPFLLRRKKQEVLKELPEKIEEIAYCTLSDDQRALYALAVAKSKKRLIEEVAHDNRGSYIHIFALLTELKRICNHPSLITKNHSGESGKWDLFIELLREAKESGQKVVVFSQYLEMLDIIEAYLKKNHIGYASVRGSTTNRREEIRKFQEDPHIEVFVASLQAVGVGVDLTAASVVIHYDRWWNPAKENQATDRVHRIGQSRGVQVFKMVTKGTIEERIHELIEKKKGLSSEVLPHDDEEEIRSLSKDELLHLLIDLEENPES